MYSDTKLAGIANIRESRKKFKIILMFENIAWGQM